MGGLIAKFFGNTEARILMVGLDAAGKTTILYKLKLGEMVTTIPTIGFNVERVNYKKTEFTIWDIGGQHKIRPLWNFYYSGCKCIIFAVDSADVERVSGTDDSAAEELHRMLAADELKDAALLVLANKQDLPGAMTVSQLTERLRLPQLGGSRKWYIQGCCASTGDGLYEGLDWISRAIQQ